MRKALPIALLLLCAAAPAPEKTYSVQLTAIQIASIAKALSFAALACKDYDDACAAAANRIEIIKAMNAALAAQEKPK